MQITAIGACDDFHMASRWAEPGGGIDEIVYYTKNHGSGPLLAGKGRQQGNNNAKNRFKRLL